MSMKNSSDSIGNRTRDLPACNTVPQPNATPRAPADKEMFINNFKISLIYNGDTIRLFFPGHVQLFRLKNIRLGGFLKFV
jgi:hypothetical protein